MKYQVFKIGRPFKRREFKWQITVRERFTGSVKNQLVLSARGIAHIDLALPAHQIVGHIGKPVAPLYPLNILRPGIPSQLGDRKSTRLNSSHVASSSAVLVLKKKMTAT